MSIVTQARQILLRWLSESVPADEAVWPDVERYKVLRAYYDTADLYQRIGYGLTGSGATKKQINALRSPARRVVEFHAAHLFPGTLPEALPIEADNARIKDPIEQIWQWSNWGARKQVYARWLSIRDTYIKVSQKKDGRPYFQLIESRFVPERELDERGFVTYIRVSYPISEKVDGQKKTRYHTEVWSKDAGTYRRWKTDANYADLDQLGSPLETKSIESFGIDFVPFVWVPFEEVEPGVPSGAFEPYLEKIDEANHMATRLHDMLFRYDRALWATSRTGFGPDGRELPRVKIEGTYSQSYNPATDEWSGTGDERSDPGVRTLGDDPFVQLPSNTTINALVPSINYSDALAILNAQLEDLKQDMPELLYPDTKDASAQESGIALRYRLAPAIDKVIEARGNAEAGIIRADQMALTMASNFGLKDFRNLGNFEAGDFEHTFEERDVIAMSPREELELEEIRQRIEGQKRQATQEPTGSIENAASLIKRAVNGGEPSNGKPDAEPARGATNGRADSGGNRPNPRG